MAQVLEVQALETGRKVISLVTRKPRVLSVPAAAAGEIEEAADLGKAAL